jgi:hypothetical protein
MRTRAALSGTIGERRFRRTRRRRVNILFLKTSAILFHKNVI